MPRAASSQPAASSVLYTSESANGRPRKSPSAEPHDAAQVVEVAALLDVGDAVRERDVAVDALPRAELARGIERDVVERQRAQPRSAPGAGCHRARASGPVAPRPDRTLQATHGGDVALLHEAVLLFGREARITAYRQIQKPFSGTLRTISSPGQGATFINNLDRYSMLPFDPPGRMMSMAAAEANAGNRGRPTRAAPRISDVAALAGVSVGTVSKALNGRGQLREQTRERVRAAAEQLGFEPNSVARSLLAGRTYTVGLITTDHYGRFSIPLMRGAEDALGAGEMAAFMCESREDPIREQHYVRTLLSRRVDGIIVAGRRTDARAPLAQHLPIPVVYAYAPSGRPGRLLGGQRRGRGRPRRRRAPARSRSAPDRPRDRPARPPLGARARGELRGDARGERPRARRRPRLVRRLERDLGAAGGPEPRWPRDREIDAVFCGSDQIARGVADGLRECGLSLPEDVALVGVDNWEALAENCRPPLTTIDLKLEAVGRTAGELLLAAIDGRPTGGTHVIAPTLVVRESSGPPARP